MELNTGSSFTVFWSNLNLESLPFFQGGGEEWGEEWGGEEWGEEWGGVVVGGDTDIQERGRYTSTAQGPQKRYT